MFGCSHLVRLQDQKLGRRQRDRKALEYDKNSGLYCLRSNKESIVRPVSICDAVDEHIDQARPRVRTSLSRSFTKGPLNTSTDPMGFLIRDELIVNV
jgi:hypothetical protein